MKRIRPVPNQSGSGDKRQPDLQDENASRTDPFVVPENYFDELPQRVMDRIAVDKQKQLENPQPSPMLRRVWMAAAAAAAIAVIFMMTKPAAIIPAKISPVTNSTDASVLTQEYDQTYADEALLLEENAITDKDISSINYKTMGIRLNCPDTTAVSSEEIIQYLLDENCDTDLIAEL